MKEKKKKQKNTQEMFGTLEVSVLLILTCIISIFSGTFLGNKFFVKKTATEIPIELNEVIDNYNYIIENFYGEVNKEDVVKGAIKGMIESLGDNYTSFLDPVNSDTLNIQLNGSFVGVGVEIINGDEGITIHKVIENSPASKEGLKAGDVFLKLDDIDLSEKSTIEFTNLIKEQTSKFDLLIKRSEKQITKKLYKDEIVLKSVHSKMHEKDNKKIGYLKVELFASNTYEQFKEKLHKLESENINGLIIDVRFNSGGHLSSVGDILSLFLDSTHIIYQTESKEGIKKTYSKGTITKKYPIVVLSNGDSASASELLMGTLRDELGAKIVGTQSFGKGTVQELNTISSQDQYKITTKKWLTPKGTFIDKVGLQPDVIIEQDHEYYDTLDEAKDTQLKEALKLFFKP